MMGKQRLRDVMTIHNQFGDGSVPRPRKDAALEMLRSAQRGTGTNRRYAAYLRRMGGFLLALILGGGTDEFVVMWCTYELRSGRT